MDATSKQKSDYFKCTGCGYCCGHEPGYVFLTPAEAEAMASFLKVSMADFTAKFCRKVKIGTENRVSLIEHPDYDCIFYKKGEGCSVYPVRPMQCRTYPFWPSIALAENTWLEESLCCPGINKKKGFPDGGFFE